MSFLTKLALNRRSVTILLILLILGAGMFTYRNLQRELWPDVDFPVITVSTIYPSADPETVEREVTDPIEDAITGMSGLKDIQSTSSQNQSLVFASFEFGEDMEEVERTVEGNISGIQFPPEVADPLVRRVNSDEEPVLQFSVIGDRDIPSLQRIADELIIPHIEQVDGVFRSYIIGKLDEQVLVTVNTDKLQDLGFSLLQLSTAIHQNNQSIPAGDIDNRGTSFALRTSHELGSLNEIRDLVIGYERLLGTPVGTGGEERPVRVKDVAEVRLGTADATTISRTNGRPSVGIAVLKSPDQDTIKVADAVLEALTLVPGVPSDVEIITISDGGRDVRRQLGNLTREGLLGFVFAIAVVFVWLLNFRPNPLKGMLLTLRPAAIIGVSIPLSILTAILMMGAAGLTLNFMTLAGLAIAVGRVVDDSIVVLENIYTHIQAGDEPGQAAFEATREVAAAIVSTTLTTIVVFLPLAFIPGLLSSFFTPMVMAVSFALVASTLVALTVVPVLGAMLLRRAGFTDDQLATPEADSQETRLQRLYTPIILWALGHKTVTVLSALAITTASLGLIFIIPIRLFPAGSPEFLTIDLELPTAASVGRTFSDAVEVEQEMARLQSQGFVENYHTSIGGSMDFHGVLGAQIAEMNSASLVARVGKDAPEGIVDDVRVDLPGDEDTTIAVIGYRIDTPPESDLEISISGKDFSSVSSAARELEAAIESIDGIINVDSDITEAKPEVVIEIDPEEAAVFGLTAATVGQQVNQFALGLAVTEVELEGETMDVVVRGLPEEVDDIDELKGLTIEGPLGQVALGAIAEIAIESGPVSISRFDGERSATITGNIVGDDTRTIGQQVQARIDALQVPPGVEVKILGVFRELAESFQDVSLAITVGVVLLYIVMVASLGSLRNPFVITISLPLAVVGALVALAVSGRTTSMSSLMGVLTLTGVVVDNSIVLFARVEQLREQGMSVPDSLVQGARGRVRPIFMTVSTTVIALVPLAVSPSGGGSLIGAELATVVIGGLISSTFLTLIVVPVVYSIMHVSLPEALILLRPSMQNRELAGHEAEG